MTKPRPKTKPKRARAKAIPAKATANKELPLIDVRYDRSKLETELASVCRITKGKASKFIDAYLSAIQSALFAGHSIELHGLGELQVVPLPPKLTVSEFNRLSGNTARLNILFRPLGRFIRGFAAADKSTTARKINVVRKYETSLLHVARNREEAESLANALHVLWLILIDRGVIVYLHGIGRLAIAPKLDPRVIDLLRRERGLKRMVIFKQKLSEVTTSSRDIVGTTSVVYAPLTLNGPLRPSNVALVPPIPVTA